MKFSCRSTTVALPATACRNTSFFDREIRLHRRATVPAEIRHRIDPRHTQDTMGNFSSLIRNNAPIFGKIRVQHSLVVNFTHLRLQNVKGIGDPGWALNPRAVTDAELHRLLWGSLRRGLPCYVREKEKAYQLSRLTSRHRC